MGNGGPAFPCDYRSLGHGADGMSLRDYFAAAALPEYIRVSCEYPDEFNRIKNKLGISIERGIALASYAIADAMLAERAKHG